MTNPKSIAYYGSLFAVLISPDSPPWIFIAVVGISVSVSALWWLLVVFLLSSEITQMKFVAARRSMDIFMGGVLVLIGLRLVFNR